jgi:hypothetical protein
MGAVEPPLQFRYAPPDHPARQRQDFFGPRQIADSGAQRQGDQDQQQRFDTARKEEKHPGSHRRGGKGRLWRLPA